jgi:hypothetical protein
MRREIFELRQGRRRFIDRLRIIPALMPLGIFFYCLFAKGLILSGRAGIFYALQRMTAEACLSLMLLETQLRKKTDIGLSSDIAPSKKLDV